MFAFFVGVVIKRLQHHCGHRRKENSSGHQRRTHVSPGRHCHWQKHRGHRLYAPIASITFSSPTECVQWVIWEQTHGKVLKNSIKIHKIFLDKLTSNYLENAAISCRSINVPIQCLHLFLYFPFRIQFSDDMKHNSTVSVFSVFSFTLDQYGL